MISVVLPTEDVEIYIELVGKRKLSPKCAKINAKIILQWTYS